MENNTPNENKNLDQDTKPQHPKFFSTQFRPDRALLLFCIIIFLATLTLKIFEPQLASAQTEGSSDAIQISLLEELPGLTEEGLNSAKARENLFGYYINGLMTTAIYIVSALAVIMLTWGGVEYIISGSFSGKEVSKERITNAIFGLLLILGAYILLTTINPNLIRLDVKPKSIQLSTSGIDTKVNFDIETAFTVNKVAREIDRLCEFAKSSETVVPPTIAGGSLFPTRDGKITGQFINGCDQKKSVFFSQPTDKKEAYEKILETMDANRQCVQLKLAQIGAKNSDYISVRNSSSGNINGLLQAYTDKNIYESEEDCAGGYLDLQTESSCVSYENLKNTLESIEDTIEKNKSCFSN